MEKSFPKGRAKLSTVIQGSGNVVKIDDVVRVLELSRTDAAKQLSRWTKQGWLRRVGTGAYIPVQLEYLDSKKVLEDPWILIPTLFAPAYIGGRTAAEYWDLTEQIFRDIVVFTSRPAKALKDVEQQHAIFTLKKIKKEKIFGTKIIWRGQEKILISDVHRTVIDMLDDPKFNGGIQHVADCFNSYMDRVDCNPEALINYAQQNSNGAVFKRLGFLSEFNSKGASLSKYCKKYLTKGVSKLDPSLDCHRLITRWNLRVPNSWLKGPPHD